MIQVMLPYTRADTYFNALMKVGTQLLGNISDKVTTSTDQMHSFFYKNIFYKNIEAEICEILRIY